MKSTVTCPECKYVSITFDPFMNLLLPIKDNRYNNDCVDTKVDGMTSSNGFEFRFIYISDDYKQSPKIHTICIPKDIIDTNSWTKFLGTIYEYCTYKIEGKQKENWKDKAMKLREYRRKIYRQMSKKAQYSNIFYPIFDVNDDTTNEQEFGNFYKDKGTFNIDKDLDIKNEINYYYMGESIKFDDQDGWFAHDLVTDDELLGNKDNEPKIKTWISKGNQTKEIYVRRLPAEMLTKKDYHNNVKQIDLKKMIQVPLNLITKSVTQFFGSMF